MITDNQTNTVYFSALLKTDKRFSDFCSKLTGILQKHNITYKFLESTNDIWCRDYMPVQVTKEKFVQYIYDPDYLLDKKGRKIKSYPEIVCAGISLKTEKTNLIMDDGNVIKYGNTVIMTDKVIPENAHRFKKAEFMSQLESLFETDRIILIPWVHDPDPWQNYGHADGMVRLIDENTVLVDGCYWDKSYDPEGRILLERLKKSKLDIVPLKFNEPFSKWSEDTWGYLNYLQMKDLLLIPVFNNHEENQEALDQISKLFPEYAANGKIETIDSTALIKEGGVLNCISWNMVES